jgi:hypothetical protein
MALRATLNEVVEAVRNETRKSTNTSRGVDHRDHIVQLVKRHYYSLCEDYDWQHLELKRDSAVGRVQLAAGQRYYTFPTALNQLYIEQVWVKWGSSWSKLDFGVSYAQYSQYDPDANQRADPAISWTFYGGDQFEVWPLPASNGVANGNGEIAFQGQAKPEQLTGDSSRLDLDDMLVSLTASAEILAEEGQATAAKVKADAAVARLGRIRANMGSKRRYAMGLGEVLAGGSRFPRHPTYIRSSS